MAQFEIALAKTLKFEGGYSNNPNDAETFCGINRKFWPDWIGWGYVDHIKAGGYTPKPEDGQFKIFVADFYRLNFWTPIRGDEIESQEIANYLFDFAVNSGISDAVKALQWAINRTLYTSEVLKVDGALGDKTLDAFNEISEDYFSEVASHMRAYRLHHILKNVASGNIHLSFAKGLGERALA